MRERIVYTPSGQRFYLGEREVTERVFRQHTQGRDQKRFQEMVSANRPPHAITDAGFMRGTANGSQFENSPHIGNALREVANEYGVDVKGKKYLGQLARFPGDPRAWVDSRAEAQRVAEENGWGFESGLTKVAARGLDKEPEPGPGLAEDIVNDTVAEILQDVPDPQHVDVADLKEQVKEKHTHYSRKGKSKAGTV